MRDGSFIRCLDIASQRSYLESAPSGSQPPLSPRVLPREQATQDGHLPAADVNLGRVFGLDGSRDEDGNVRSCPALTFPKLIPTLANLYHFRTLDEVFQKSPDGDRGPQLTFGSRAAGSSASRKLLPDAAAPTNHEYAHAYNVLNNTGAQATFNLWSPFVEQNTEFSLSQLWTVRGQYSDSSLQSVEAGWQVFQNLYGDSKAHLFIYSTSAAYTSGSGCYNLTCSRFVQTNSSVVFGGAFSSYSELGGDQYEIQLTSYRDPGTGDWWVEVGNTMAGYYPHTLFAASGLLNYASSIDFGGEIVNDAASPAHTSTDMGSGHFPSEGFGRAAYIRKVAYFDLSENAFYAGSLTKSVTNANYYDLSLFTGDPDWHTYFYFGGPGGSGGQPAVPNLAPYQPAGWTDRIVVSTSTGTTAGNATDSSPLKPTDSLFLNWAAKNSGEAPTASRFYVDLYVDGVAWSRQFFYADPPLDAGAWLYWGDVPFGSLSAGTHTIQMVVDSTNAIGESSESDNSYTRTVTVGAPSQPCGTAASRHCALAVSPRGIATISGGR